MWKQPVDPFNNIGLSALVALLPVLFIFWALIIKKMKGYQASLLATLLALVIAISIYDMPVLQALQSTGKGALYGLFPICWITVSAIFLFNIIVASGQFDVIKNFMASITSDRRLQVLLIAFSFGSFLEGTAGFATPVVICAAMLTGMGFQPLQAAGICLIANTAPVAFGAVGIPIVVAAQVSGIPEMAISQMVGRTLPALSVVLPFYLVYLVCGYKKTIEVWPATLTAGISFAFFQWFCSNFMGPSLPDVIAGIASIVALLILLRCTKNKRKQTETANAVQYTTGQVFKAWSPFLILTVMIICWGMPPVKSALNEVGPALSASGTAILFSALISIFLLGLRRREVANIFLSTCRQLRFPVITIAFILAFAYIINHSGISHTLATALASTGMLFPFFAPVLGWLGVFITGSDTSSNALFGSMQSTTARSIGIDPVITVAANCSGGVVGKMISPQSIAVAAAAGGLVGNESQLFRYTVKHSFIMLGIISAIVMAQAYWMPWLTPQYTMNAAIAPANAEKKIKTDMKIVVLDGHTLNPGDLDWDDLKRLGRVDLYERTSYDQVVERAAKADVILTNKVPLDEYVLQHLPQLQYIGVLATGYNVIDIQAAAKKRVVVTNAPSYSSSSVAQLSFALLLELCHHVQQHSDSVKAGKWSKAADWCYWDFPLMELAGKTMGIIGLGNIGMQVATIAAAFGMNILAAVRQNTITTSLPNLRRATIPELLLKSDVVSLHCPLLPETKGLINHNSLSTMKRSAFLLNTSRGPLINDDDLARALNNDIIAGAGLDVLTVEPPASDNPLFTAKNCIITPHIGWATREARARLMEIAVDNLRRFIAGKPVNVVN